jgi:spore coat polysaccharide biosynthesis predicted glycosyltransferase SpsG
MHVVIGPSFKHYDELKKNENERIRFYFNPKMSVLMTKCDIAISSCGSTLYELAACGTPTIGIVIVDNQLMAAEYMSKSGSIIYSDINDLLFSIEELTYEQRKVMSISGKKLVDGLGVFRIIDKIEKRLNL